MPLLLVAILTHVIYKAVSNGLDWTGEASRKAWAASMAGSRSAADRLRQRMTDTLDSWDKDPRARRYAATAVRMTLGTGRLLGKIGLGTLFAAIKAAGAVSRGVVGGAILGSGIVRGLASSARWGARAGTEWWNQHHGSGKWRWVDWFPEWSKRVAARIGNWGNTVPSTATPSAEQPKAAPGASGSTPPKTPPPPSDPPEDDRPPVVVLGWGDPIEEKDQHPTISHPTPLESSPPEQSAAIPAASKDGGATVIEGEIMGTDLVPGQNVEALSPGDEMKYDSALSYLAEQKKRIDQTSELATRIQALQVELASAAKKLGEEHGAAAEALSRFGVAPPSFTEAVSLLMEAASPVPAETAIATFQALDTAGGALLADADHIRANFGAAREMALSMEAKGVNPTFVHS